VATCATAPQEVPRRAAFEDLHGSNACRTRWVPRSAQLAWRAVARGCDDGGGSGWWWWQLSGAEDGGEAAELRGVTDEKEEAPVEVGRLA
jgi:hypothetical protein